jgi:guanosine-3',5'-bis(diphosphate) 3'-pyrophosphohydrolase
MFNFRFPSEKVIFAKALAFARWHHLGHVRKYTGEPYVNHLINVADTVSHVKYRTTEMVVAAFLHDVLEDTAASEADIAANFGSEVLAYVLALSDERFNEPKVGNRKERKAATMVRLAGEDWHVQTIKLADLIDNSASITKYDPNFARVFMKEKEQLLTVLTSGDYALKVRARAIIDNYHARSV